MGAFERELESLAPTDALFDRFVGPLVGESGEPEADAAGPAQEASQGQAGKAAQYPLQEDEKKGLLSEWYALAKAKQPKASSQPPEKGTPPLASSSPSEPLVRPPLTSTGKASAPAGGQGPSPTAAPSSTATASARSRPSTPASPPPKTPTTNNAAAADSARSDGRLPGTGSAAGEGARDAPSPSISREEEDAYVAAVLRNLELVASKVAAAEARIAKAAALAKSGDPAAKAAKVAAEAQLDPLREQLEQLQMLRQSLQEMSSEPPANVFEEAGGWSDAGSRSGGGGSGGGEVMQEAEVVEMGSRSNQTSPASSLPKPSVISGVAPPPSGARSWGAWGRNQRIKDADVALIKQKQGQEFEGQPRQEAKASSTASTMAPPEASPAAMPDSRRGAFAQDGGSDDDEKVVIVSKKSGEGGTGGNIGGQSYGIFHV